MSNLVPRNMRRPLGWLRDSVMDAAERLMPERRGQAEQSPVVSVFTQGGPAVDLVEDDDEIRVTAELPGVDKDQFTVELAGNRLILRGEKKSSHEERKGDYYYSERSYGSFSRTVHLPAEVDADKAEGRFENGELRLRLPKTEDAKLRRRKIPVD